MAGLGPEQPIEAPPLTPPPNGLLLSAPVITLDDDDGRWIAGVKYQGDSVSDAVVLDPCSTSSIYVSTYADGATTNASPNLTSATARFNALDVGRAISGSGIPGGTTIQSVTNATTVVLSANATATATGVTIALAGPRNTRPSPTSLTPFPVMVQDTCSAFGFAQAEYEARARRALAARESQAVEREFSLAAVVTSNRHLQDNTNTKLNNSNAYSVRSSLAALVQAVADYKLGAGMIHARPYLVELWHSLGLVTLANKKLYTAAGVLVIPGYGYTGGAPDGTVVSPTAEWAYATDYLQVMRGPVEVFATEQDRAASFDRVNNTVTVAAQRFYSVQGNFQTIVGAKVDTTNLG